MQLVCFEFPTRTKKAGKRLKLRLSPYVQISITSTSYQYERVHRLGEFTQNKGRPTIAKSTFFKDKQAILDVAELLKNTGISVSKKIFAGCIASAQETASVCHGTESSLQTECRQTLCR